MKENQSEVESEKALAKPETDTKDDSKAGKDDCLTTTFNNKAEMLESKAKTVEELIEKIKNDGNLSNGSKMDTLAILVMRFVEENSE